jgi:hypothetical protein
MARLRQAVANTITFLVINFTERVQRSTTEMLSHCSLAVWYTVATRTLRRDSPMITRIDKVTVYVVSQEEAKKFWTEKCCQSAKWDTF